jgi:hypothetical protein
MTREQDQWRRGENGKGPPAVFYGYDGEEYVELDLESNLVYLPGRIAARNGSGIIKNLEYFLSSLGYTLTLPFGVLVPRHIR